MKYPIWIKQKFRSKSEESSEKGRKDKPASNASLAVSVKTKPDKPKARVVVKGTELSVRKKPHKL